MNAFLRNWWPALVWAGVIFTLSTDSFSAAHTASFFDPIFKRLIPSLTHHQLAQLNHAIRKCAHFTEYFVFYLFLFRGFRRGQHGWRWTWALAALAVAAVYASLDEVHQAFVASRGASPWDSLLDSFGAFIAAGVVWLWFQFRRRASSGPGLAPETAPD